MTDPARRLPKPVLGPDLVEQPERVVASKDDLLDGQLQPRHDYFSFAGSVPTNFTARSIQVLNCSSSSISTGSTSTQPFIGRPVMSNSRTCSSFSASWPSSGPSRTIRESFQTPTSRLPL